MSHAIINIISVEKMEDYRLHFTFNDNKQQTIDFKAFLTNTRHPDIRRYLDPEKFAEYRIEYGELIWGDYELCFPIIDLYRNQLDHNVTQEAAA
ncbi:DUF2442 domain-containing protein [Crenothrix polyspora]|uniref:DUF2442 domain-containing protein n=1 Tax=Crenothrix polyspora TaxID=360316 RepID=A0A1R4H5Q3_9GAMM|nr:DUF2442 domain-containing protein [Crenothrix polyspora]SJM91361.1 conserved hypothetical protein [Crenothrix polyspora]